MFIICENHRASIFAENQSLMLVWTRTTGTDMGIGPGAPNFELMLVARWALPRDMLFWPMTAQRPPVYSSAKRRSIHCDRPWLGWSTTLQNYGGVSRFSFSAVVKRTRTLVPCLVDNPPTAVRTRVRIPTACKAGSPPCTSQGKQPKQDMYVFCEAEPNKPWYV